MDKSVIVPLIIERLSAELATVAEASRDARAAATHEDARAEDKYDTRATESSYLADGQARLAAELMEAVELYRTLSIRSFGPGEPIALTALVTIEQRGQRDRYFVGPRNGGLTIEHEGEIMVITPQSPLGRELLGRRAGDPIRLGAGREANIAAVE